MNKDVENFLNACDELCSCKFLVAEYKIQKMLKALASAQEVCELVGECLEQFNRDREFSKTYVEDANGDFVCVMPEEEYKIIALVFCTLVDMDAKKIDFTDFIKRFFGREKDPYLAFVNTMIVPFRNLIAEAFGQTCESESETADEQEEELEEQDEQEEGDKFVLAQKIAVQILSELQFGRQDDATEAVTKICRAIVKTADLKDEDVTESLVDALKFYKVRPIKFMVRELFDIFD